LEIPEVSYFSVFRIFETDLEVTEEKLRVSFSTWEEKEGNCKVLVGLKLEWKEGGEQLLLAGRKMEGEEKGEGRVLSVYREEEGGGSWRSFCFEVSRPPLATSIRFIDVIVAASSPHVPLPSDSHLPPPLSPSINFGSVSITSGLLEEGGKAEEGGFKVSYALCWRVEGGERGEEIADLVLSWEEGGNTTKDQGVQYFRIWRGEGHLEGIALTSHFQVQKLNFSELPEYLFFVEPVSPFKFFPKYPIIVTINQR
jgi:hypothetical protein